MSTTESITPKAIYALRTISCPRISPDGNSLVYVRSIIDKTNMEVMSDLILHDILRNELRPVVPGKSNGHPSFSPDGKMLAFTRPDNNGERQIWLADTYNDRGVRQLTFFTYGVVEYSWSPSCNEIAVISDVNISSADRNEPGSPNVRLVTRIRYRSDSIGWRGSMFRHVFVVNVIDGHVRQLTEGEGDDTIPMWSPDGQRLAFISDNRIDRDIVSFNEVRVVSSKGGDSQCWSDGLWTIATLTWSPSGDSLAVVASDDRHTPGYVDGDIFVISPVRRAMKLTDDTISPVGGYPPTQPPPEIKWATDGNIIFLGDSKGATFVCMISTDRPIQQILSTPTGKITDISIDRASSKAVILQIPTDSSGDLWLIDIRKDECAALTEINRTFFDTHPTAHLHKFQLRRHGRDIESRVFLPPKFSPDLSYPLILDIHGGPHSAFYDSFNLIQQMLATFGYIVLAINPRGSSTYGPAFLKDVIGDWGGEDYLDIMAVVNEISERPYVDATRLGVTGYSYGGFMSGWIIGHDTRFKAAVIGAPCTNLWSMYGTSDIGVRFGELQWGSLDQSRPENLLFHSPLTYASEVETPVLLLHGEVDLRCPIDQSEQYFVALKRLNKIVEFVRFPDCSHSFLSSGHPKMREEYLSRLLIWMNKYIGNVSR